MLYKHFNKISKLLNIVYFNRIRYRRDFSRKRYYFL